MQKYIPILKKSKLFSGIDDFQLLEMLKCLCATVNMYKKDEFVFHFGENISSVGLILSGSVDIIKEDYWGNKTILSRITEGMLFGESYSCSPDIPISVNVTASQKTEIMFLNVKKIISVCPSSCSFHTKLIQNFVSVIALKNVMLTNKIEHISQRTTKSKLLSYLSEQSQKNASSYFEIPFNRQQLADFLSVDRSAMSNELCKLRDEGILDFHKNKFKIL